MQTKEEKAIEIAYLSAKINVWLFNIGFFAGQMFLCFLVSLAMGQMSMVTALGCFFTIATIGSYQYREHLKNNFDKLIEDFKKEQDNENLSS